MLEDTDQNLPQEDRVARYIELGKQWSAGHDNRMIKVPATPAGLAALEELAAAGVTLNVTLILTMSQYTSARDAIWRGATQVAVDLVQDPLLWLRIAQHSNTARIVRTEPIGIRVQGVAQRSRQTHDPRRGAGTRLESIQQAAQVGATFASDERVQLVNHHKAKLPEQLIN